MPIPIVTGHGETVTTTGYLGIFYCDYCKAHTHHFLRTHVYDFRLFFVSLFDTSTSYIFYCGKCQKGKHVKKDEYEKLLIKSNESLSIDKTVEMWEFMFLKFHETYKNLNYDKRLIIEETLSQFGQSGYVYEHIQKALRNMDLAISKEKEN